MRLKDSRKLLTALADETRLRILNLLGRGELCVCDMMRVLKEPQSKVSRHLAYLRRAGVVEARREGLWMHYRLSKTSLKAFQALSASLGCGSSEIVELKRDLSELQKNKGCLVGCCD